MFSCRCWQLIHGGFHLNFQCCFKTLHLHQQFPTLISVLFVYFLYQVFRSKLDSDPGLSLHQPKSGSASPLQHGAATLGRNMSSKVHRLFLFNRYSDVSIKLLLRLNSSSVCLLPLMQQSPLLVPNSTGSLPRNLAATLQDIETKRQLALQQKGNQPAPCWALFDTNQHHFTQKNCSCIVYYWSSIDYLITN